ncbi:peptidase dimerization domain-containing protein [Bacillaceae bacterium Marseille-Q3522]|nr:peptidase dimerization domain-containing protein [Bacillaceae bacterium Marseille-Q3522]
MIHPSGRTFPTTETLAVDVLDFEYIGKAAHASGSPEKGINALDAVIQFYNGINALRQHVTSDVRIHGIITDGGLAPNIVPDYAKARFFVRANSRKALNKVTDRVKKVAEGAGIQTGAKLNIIRIQNGVNNFWVNHSFDAVFTKVAKELNEPLEELGKGKGSTDAGNISQVIPTIHLHIKIGSTTLAGHTDEFREAARCAKGDEALIKGAKLLALTALELYANPDVLAEIKKEYEETKAREA